MELRALKVWVKLGFTAVPVMWALVVALAALRWAELLALMVAAGADEAEAVLEPTQPYGPHAAAVELEAVAAATEVEADLLEELTVMLEL